jgi:hypothetical protein
LDSEKAEVLVDSVEATFQPVNDVLEPVVSENINKVMRAYFFTLSMNPS